MTVVIKDFLMSPMRRLVLQGHFASSNKVPLHKSVPRREDATRPYDDPVRECSSPSRYELLTLSCVTKPMLPAHAAIVTQL